MTKSANGPWSVQKRIGIAIGLLIGIPAGLVLAAVALFFAFIFAWFNAGAFYHGDGQYRRGVGDADFQVQFPLLDLSHRKILIPPCSLCLCGDPRMIHHRGTENTEGKYRPALALEFNSTDALMAFTIDPEPNEEVFLEAEYAASEKSEPFAFGVSNRAVFLPAKKRFVLTNDPFYFKRVPLSDVREIRIRRLRPLFLYVLAFAMVVIGGYTTYWMFSPEYAGNGGRIRGWPIAITVGGLVLPFAARGRYALVVSQTKGTYRWKPPLVVDRTSKNRIAEILTAIVTASRRTGIHVFDERATPP